MKTDVINARTHCAASRSLHAHRVSSVRRCACVLIAHGLKPDFDRHRRRSDAPRTLQRMRPRRRNRRQDPLPRPRRPGPAACYATANLIRCGRSRRLRFSFRLTYRAPHPAPPHSPHRAIPAERSSRNSRPQTPTTPPRPPSKPPPRRCPRPWSDLQSRAKGPPHPGSRQPSPRPQHTAATAATADRGREAESAAARARMSSPPYRLKTAAKPRRSAANLAASSHARRSIGMLLHPQADRRPANVQITTADGQQHGQRRHAPRSVRNHQRRQQQTDTVTHQNKCFNPKRKTGSCGSAKGTSEFIDSKPHRESSLPGHLSAWHPIASARKDRGSALRRSATTAAPDA